jgi:hypothetical protein
MLVFIVFLADVKKQTSFILNRLASAKQPRSGQKVRKGSVPQNLQPGMQMTGQVYCLNVMRSRPFGFSIATSPCAGYGNG